MKKIKVISKKNLPARLPTLSTAVAYLFLDKFNAPGWVWGVASTLFFILWVLIIVTICVQENVEILKSNGEQKAQVSDTTKML